MDEESDTVTDSYALSLAASTRDKGDLKRARKCRERDAAEREREEEQILSDKEINDGSHP